MPHQRIIFECCRANHISEKGFKPINIYDTFQEETVKTVVKSQDRVFINISAGYWKSADIGIVVANICENIVGVDNVNIIISGVDPNLQWCLLWKNFQQDDDMNILISKYKTFCVNNKTGKGFDELRNC